MASPRDPSVFDQDSNLSHSFCSRPVSLALRMRMAFLSSSSVKPAWRRRSRAIPYSRSSRVRSAFIRVSAETQESIATSPGCNSAWQTVFSSVLNSPICLLRSFKVGFLPTSRGQKAGARGGTPAVLPNRLVLAVHHQDPGLDREVHVRAGRLATAGPGRVVVPVRVRARRTTVGHADGNRRERRERGTRRDRVVEGRLHTR